MQFKHLKKSDLAVEKLIQAETRRQDEGLEMIASENFVSPAVLEALGSPLTNKYSEGYPGKRYYAGNEIIDQIETLAIERAKKLFGAEHANVQPHAGSQANMAAYAAFLKPGDTILALDLAHGGHLTHGASVNFSGKLYRFVHYGVDKITHRIDMKVVREIALREKPKMIVAGATAYPRAIDFKEFRKIADEVGAKLMVDMAHIAGLVAAGLHESPISIADVVTTTTHKTLRGPRGAVIFCKADYAKLIDSAVFPGLQGGPLEHAIAAKAVAFKEAATPGFKKYAGQVVKNAKALADELMHQGVSVISDGTDNHLILINVLPLGITGKEAETLLSNIGISTNKNMIPFDTRSPFDPSGLRIGTAALSTRGMKEKEMRLIAAIIAETLRTKSTKLAKSVRVISKKFPLGY
ncbi:MAG: serine hydroxymethyltransferase [bacterium]